MAAPDFAATFGGPALERKKTVRRLLMLGTLTYGIAVVFARGSSMLVVLLLSRLITPGDLGAVSYIMAVYTILTVLADIGISSTLPRLVPRAAQPQTLIVHALGLKLMTSVGLACGVWIVDLSTGAFRGFGAQIAVLVACSTFSAAVSVLDASLKFVPASVTRSAVGLGWIAGSVVLVRFGWPVWGPVLAYGFSTLLAGLPTCWRSLRGYAAGFDASVLRQLVHFGVRVLAVLIFSSITAQAGLVVLAYARGDEAAAIYRVASIIASVPVLLAAAVGDPLTSLVARLDAGADPSEVRRLLQPVLALLAATAGVMVPLAMLFGPDVLRVLVPGEYGRSSDLLILLVAANALGMLNSVATGVLYALGELRVLVRASAVAALTAAVGTGVLLAPLGDLSAGAALFVANLLQVVWLGSWFRGYLRGSVSRTMLLWVSALTGGSLALAGLLGSAGDLARIASGALILVAYAGILLGSLRPYLQDSGIAAHWGRRGSHAS